MSEKHIGKVIQVIGPVLDIQFEDGQLPELLNAIEIDNHGEKLIVEVAQLTGDNVARCIAMSSTDGLVRGTEAVDTGESIKVPVGDQCLGRVFNVLGEPVVRIMDPKVFLDAQQTGRDIREQRAYLAEYKKYVEQTVVYDREYRLLICIMRDVTDEESEREKKENISRKTVEIADKVVDKQMRIVQEIASLLGETAAETKIALTKLKESISDE